MKTMTVEKGNKMGTWPENRLLLNMSVPIMISMLVQALYNVVDSYFVAQLADGEDALAAVALAFPVQNLMIAVSVGVGVGINALLSRSLGEKRKDKADLVAMQGVFIEFVCFLIFFLVGLFGAKAIIGIQTNDPKILEYATDYLWICCVFSIGVFMQVTFERLLQATGRTVLSMITQGAGAITNIVLDPIFIFGWLGVPKMGVAGAAVATVIGQCVAAVVGLVCNLLCNKDITFRIKNIIPHPRIIKQILVIGIPSVVMSAIGSVMTFSMNQILIGFHKTAVAVFGLYFKLQSFVFMPVFGLNNGMIPIVAYNYGARNRSRITKTIRYSLLYAVGIMTAGLLLVQCFPGLILDMFNADDAMKAMGISAFRIISLCFVFAGASIVMGSVCQAVGKSIYSMFTSIGRQLVVLIPVAYLLSLTGDVNMVWWAFPIAELISLGLSFIFFRTVMKRLDF